MPESLLLYNPRSGAGAAARLVPQLLQILRARYADIVAEPTSGPGTAAGQVRAAAERGVRLVIVCGGDGTLFEALQGAVHQNVTLAILPFGTGNVVARDLGLALDPVQATVQLLNFEPRQLPIGVAARSDGTRPTYFLTAAGVGLHAELMAMPKSGSGQSRSHYFKEGIRLALRKHQETFAMRCTMADGASVTVTASEMLVVRVRSFGGALKRWQPGASLAKNELRITFISAHHRLRILAFLAKVILGMYPNTPHIQTITATSIECHSGRGPADRPWPAQLDGEAFGNLPVRFATEPNAVRFLLPGSYPRG